MFKPLYSSSLSESGTHSHSVTGIFLSNDHAIIKLYCTVVKTVDLCQQIKFINVYYYFFTKYKQKRCLETLLMQTFENKNTQILAI